MVKVDIYNQEGKKIEEIGLPDNIFGVKMNADLVHQVAVSQMANRRQISADTKDRSQVRGGGRKPWRQKGTGRARVGSRRSPIWRSGGVTFGPTKDRNFKKTLPKKMKRKALLMTLSQKISDKELVVLNELKVENPKTKEMAKIINNQKIFFKSDSKKPEKKIRQTILIALEAMDTDIIRVTKNITKIATIQAKDLNVLDLLNYKYLMMPKKALEVIEKTFKIT